jgi:hypothetical protein
LRVWGAWEDFGGGCWFVVFCAHIFCVCVLFCLVIGEVVVSNARKKGPSP